MTLFATPAEHAANPPETWTIERMQLGRHDRYQIITKRGRPIGSPHITRQSAERALDSGPHVTQWEREQAEYTKQKETVAA